MSKIAITDIIIGERHRKEMGDLEALAASIREQGLLQPIGINEHKVLVFGERRLRACRDFLGLTAIEARVVNVPSIAEGEFAENEVRKNFTVSERVAIAASIKAEIGNRQGQRSDLAANAAKLTGRTDDEVAQRTGFGSAETLKRAETVVERGSPELVDEVDKGTMSISAAAKIVKPGKSKKRSRSSLDDTPPKKLPGRARDEAIVKIDAELKKKPADIIAAFVKLCADARRQMLAIPERRRAELLFEFAETLGFGREDIRRLLDEAPAS